MASVTSPSEAASARLSLMAVAVEIRQKILLFALSDGFPDSQKIWKHLLHVNHQIHDEMMFVLAQRFAFTQDELRCTPLDGGPIDDMEWYMSPSYNRYLSEQVTARFNLLKEAFELRNLGSQLGVSIADAKSPVGRKDGDGENVQGMKRKRGRGGYDG